MILDTSVLARNSYLLYLTSLKDNDKLLAKSLSGGVYLSSISFLFLLSKRLPNKSF